jgi:hypothetical protein
MTPAPIPQGLTSSSGKRMSHQRSGDTAPDRHRAHPAPHHRSSTTGNQNRSCSNELALTNRCRQVRPPPEAASTNRTRHTHRHTATQQRLRHATSRTRHYRNVRAVTPGPHSPRHRHCRARFAVKQLDTARFGLRTKKRGSTRPEQTTLLRRRYETMY